MNRSVRAGKKTMNTYVKFGLKMLICTAGGAVAGFLGAMLLLNNSGSEMIRHGCELFVNLIRSHMLFILIAILAASVVVGEINLHKLRKILMQMQDAEDEDADRLDYEAEKTGARGMVANILSQIFCILVVAPGYSAEYIEASGGYIFLICCLIFLLCLIYDGYYQVRYVKLVQKTYPEKKGDVASGKFQKQWFESCDEAERELIYQGTYKTHMFMGKLLPFIMMFAMLANLFFETGVFAVLVIAVIWILHSVTYLHSVVSGKGAKL